QSEPGRRWRTPFRVSGGRSARASARPHGRSRCGGEHGPLTAEDQPRRVTLGSQRTLRDRLLRLSPDVASPAVPSDSSSTSCDRPVPAACGEVAGREMVINELDVGPVRTLFRIPTSAVDAVGAGGSYQVVLFQDLLHRCVIAIHGDGCGAAYVLAENGAV